MDYDDQDYFPSRKSRADDVARGEHTKQMNIHRITMLGMFSHQVKGGDVCVFRSPGKPTVDFHTRRNRWQVRGQKKTTHGTVDEFAKFLADFWGEPVTRDAPGAVVTGRPIEEILPSDIHLFDANGEDLGPANKIITDVAVGDDETASEAIGRHVPEGHTLRQVGSAK